MLLLTSLLIWLQEVLSLPEVYRHVLEKHPLTRAIRLIPSLAEAQLTSTRGVWDPLLTGSYLEKNFKNQLYYTLFSSELKVPIWNGLDIKGLYENTGGFSLNPEDATPSQGLLGAGLSIPLGQGLFIDYRRAAIQKALLYAKMAPYERQIALAALLLEVEQDYWGWFAAYYKAKVYAQQLEVAQNRLRFLREALMQGEATRAETLEAYVEVGIRKQALLSAQADLLKKALLLQRHLWQEEIPSEQFLERFQPDSLIPYIPRSNWDSLIASHPKLKLYSLKRQIAEVERKWAAERLRPRLQMEYLFLRDPAYLYTGWNHPFTTNFKFGLSFTLPLYLREARGDLLEARLLIQQLSWEQAYEARSLYNKALSQLGVIDSLWRQIQIQQEVTSSSIELVQIEIERFRAGESDLFIVNRREREAFNALLNLYDLYARYGIEVASLRALLAWVD
ncbi:MAG: TolC family protein [Bacteroidia bacterium]|nr:TolC family protein [Bacteroidia bacterium]